MDWRESEKFNEYINSSVTKFQLGDFEGALEDIEKAIEINQGFAPAFWNRASCKAKLGRFEEAIQDYTRGIEIESGDCKSYISRGRCKGHLAEKKSDPERETLIREAIEDFNVAIKIAPDDFDAWYARGWARAKSREIPTEYAIDDYDEAIALNPNSWELYFERSGCYFIISDFEAALADVNKTLEINPDNLRARINRAFCLINLKRDFAGNLEDLNDIILQDPDLQDVFFARGIVNYNLKHYHNAIRDLDIALEKGTLNKFSIYRYRSIAKKEIGDLKGALKDASVIIEMKPDVGHLYTNRAAIYNQLGEYENALHDLDRAIEVGYIYPGVYDLRGRTNLLLKRYHDAIKDFEAAIELDPKYLAAYNLKGKALYFLGDLKGARESQLKILKINPNYKWAIEALKFLDKEEARRKNQQ